MILIAGRLAAIRRGLGRRGASSDAEGRGHGKCHGDARNPSHFNAPDWDGTPRTACAAPKCMPGMREVDSKLEIAAFFRAEIDFDVRHVRDDSCHGRGIERPFRHGSSRDAVANHSAQVIV